MDVIIRSISENNLIRKDSGPWERHLPGKQFAYTTIACAKGLISFAEICRSLDSEYSKQIIVEYNRLINGIKTYLTTKNKYLKGNFECTDPNEYDYFDASTFEVFNFNLIKSKSLFSSHFNNYALNLRFKEKQRGFFRINKGDWYDSQEWIFLNLRIASALKKFGESKKANQLIKWITEQSKLNFNLIAELYDEKTSAYEGACPMVGFGAGAIISYFLNDSEIKNR